MSNNEKVRSIATVLEIVAVIRAIVLVLSSGGLEDWKFVQESMAEEWL